MGRVEERWEAGTREASSGLASCAIRVLVRPREEEAMYFFQISFKYQFNILKQLSFVFGRFELSKLLALILQCKKVKEKENATAEKSLLHLENQQNCCLFSN